MEFGPSFLGGCCIKAFFRGSTFCPRGPQNLSVWDVTPAKLKKKNCDRTLRESNPQPFALEANALPLRQESLVV